MHDFSVVINLVFIIATFCYFVAGAFFLAALYVSSSTGSRFILSLFGTLFLSLGVAGTIIMERLSTS